MAEPPAKRPRVAPRHSDANEAVATLETPYANLRQLSSVIKVRKPITPAQRSLQRPPTSATDTANKTPAGTSRTPHGLRNLPRRAPPTTPHAINAVKERRNAAHTPGRERRRSGRQQRETPRDTLRDLSRVLARKTKPTEPSPQTKYEDPRNPLLDDLDVGPDVPVPRLSMPLNDLEDDDTFHEKPPRLSILLDDDESTTMHSLEGARRAHSARTMDQQSRFSEQFAELNDVGMDAGLEEFTELLPLNDEGSYQPVQFDDQGEPIINEDTQELRALMDAEARRRSRQSDLGIVAQPDDDEDDPTFYFRFPEAAAQAAAAAEDSEPEQEDEEEADVAQPVAFADEGYDHGAASQSEEEDISDDEARAEEEQQRLREDSVTVAVARSPMKKAKTVRKQRDLKISKHGIEYPALPPAVIKRLATTFARLHGGSGKLSKDTLLAITQASDWFFEQASDDLASYAKHAGRKTIDESDVVALMKRQRQLNANTTPFSLAQKYLPRELLQGVRMTSQGKPTRRKRTRLDSVEEENEE